MCAALAALRRVNTLYIPIYRRTPPAETESDIDKEYIRLDDATNSTKYTRRKLLDQTTTPVLESGVLESGVLESGVLESR